MADDPAPRPVTLKAAAKLDVFELARLWSDPNAWHLDERTVHDELAELAVMSALLQALRRWQPMAINGAMLAGARPEAVAAAIGSDIREAYERWREWAERERDFVHDGGSLGISLDEYEAVERRFARAGVSASGSRKQVA